MAPVAPRKSPERKVWARLRFRGLRTAARRVRRLMKEHGLLAPHRPTPRAAHPRDGTVATARVDQVWGTDMTETITTTEGRAYVFVAVDHCSGEFVGIHAASGTNRWEALEPIRQGVARHFGALDRPGAASGLTLRHDHGSNTMSADFQREIRFLGMTSSPAFVRQPEGNGVAERLRHRARTGGASMAQSGRSRNSSSGSGTSPPWRSFGWRWPGSPPSTTPAGSANGTDTERPIRSGLSKWPLKPKPPRSSDRRHDPRNALSQNRAPVHPPTQTVMVVVRDRGGLRLLVA